MTSDKTTVAFFLREWGSMIPFLLAGLAAIAVVLMPQQRLVSVFPSAKARDDLFTRFRSSFDEKRAYVIVSPACLHPTEEAFFFSREPGYSPGDVGNPDIPAWAGLTPDGKNSQCGGFLLNLKSARIPFYVLSSSDGNLGEALAGVVRRYSGKISYPTVVIETEVFPADIGEIQAALKLTS